MTRWYANNKENGVCLSCFQSLSAPFRVMQPISSESSNGQNTVQCTVLTLVVGLYFLMACCKNVINAFEKFEQASEKYWVGVNHVKITWVVKLNR